MNERHYPSAMQPTVPAHVVRLALEAAWPDEFAGELNIRPRIISAALEAAFPHIAAQVLRGISSDMNCADDYELCRDTADELLGAD